MLVRVLSASLIFLALALLGPSFAADDKPAPTPADIIKSIERELNALDTALNQKVDSAKQQGLRDRVLRVFDTLGGLFVTLNGQIEQVDARLEGLGPPPTDVEEAPEILKQRAALGTERAGLDAIFKRAKLAEVRAKQLLTEMDRTSVAEFSEKLSARIASPLAPFFWQQIIDAYPRDLRRLELYVEAGWTQVMAKWDGAFPWPAVLGLVAALVLLIPFRYGALRLGRRFLIEGAPGHRVRRSAYAVWRVVVGTLTPMLAMIALGQGLRWSGLLPDQWSGLFDALTTAMAFGGLAASLGGALLMPGAPSWRLAALGDAAADRLILVPRLLAVFTALGIILVAFNREVGTSPQAVMATEALTAFLYLLLIGFCLIVIARLRTAWAGNEDAQAASTNAWLGTVTLFAWISVTVAFVALLSGYIAFSLFVAQVITWATVLGCATYLAMIATDDVATSLFSRESPLGRTFVRALGIRGSAVDQFGVILSGLLRVALAVMAISMLITPFGAGGGIGTLFGRIGALGDGVEIAGISISFGGILRAALVLVAGLAAARLFTRWLERTYLPVTGWDDSGRNSFGLITRYVALSLAVIWALASLGIGAERIALLLSALSVGIGFGLQAITQNFVSGLILLAERPIKIGDLIRVGTDEGDVKRINVRSTEIVLPDHSTLIVPNSELITKTVLNKTLASPLGRVQVRFSVPLEVGPDRVRAIVLETFAAETAILENPKPVVFIDDIADGRIMFNGFAHVASPRASYGARSNVLMTLLQRFKDEGIEIGTTPQRMELVTLPEADKSG
ncbi:MAG: mechanosensitive ion channel family protein [Alphaproteobacteria bacterium]|nr:mechanosensitive ion channel family protein [Alphaproteobacteria bacterium]